LQLDITIRAFIKHYVRLLQAFKTVGIHHKV